MKIRTILFVTLIFCLLISCKKENDDNTFLPKNSHRIKQISFEGAKSIFLYEGENLVKYTDYYNDGNNNWVEVYSAEFSYSGNIVTKTSYLFFSGEKVKEDIDVYIISDGLISKETDFDPNGDEWVEFSIWEYQYSGRKLVGFKGYWDANLTGNFILAAKGEYKYEVDKISEFKGYGLDTSGNLTQNDKEIYTYSNNKLISRLAFNLNESAEWEQNYLSEFEYIGNNVSSAKYSDWYDNKNTWIVDASKTYSYNENGYLSEEIDDEGDWKTYEYEVGNGNAQMLYYYPEELLNGLPKLKSASAKPYHLLYLERILKN